MEDLRSARSYNDLIFIASRIKSASTSISSRVMRVLSKENSNMEAIRIGADCLCKHDKAKLKSAHEDLDTLNHFIYEIQFTKSLTDIITGDVKLDKFRRIVERTESDVNKAYSYTSKLLHHIGTKSSPKNLVAFTSFAIKRLAKSLTFTKQTVITIPSVDDRTSYTSFIVLEHIAYPDGFIMPELIIALHADNNFDGSFSLSVSFPKSFHEELSKTPFSTKKKLGEIFTSALKEQLNVEDLKKMRPKDRRVLELMPDVKSASLTKDKKYLQIELESGVTSSDINQVLTKVLPIVHVFLGVTDTDTDIVHKVGEGKSGNKVIRIGLLHRNFYDINSLARLKQLIGLDDSTVTSIKTIVGL